MAFGKKLRHWWHDIYYKGVSQQRMEFAMRCRDVVTHIDLHQSPAGRWGKFRLWLHLSLCQACRNYFDASSALSQAIRKNRQGQNHRERLKRLNQSLLTKYSDPFNKSGE